MYSARTILTKYRKRNYPINFKDSDLKKFQNAIYNECKPLSKIIIKNAFVLGNTIFSIRKIKYYSRQTHTYGIGRKKSILLLLNLIKKRKIIAAGIWIIDNHSFAYYHWLVESLTRLVIISDEEKEYPIILPMKYRSLSYVQESLSILGFNILYYNENDHLLVKKLILPDITVRGMCFSNESLFGLKQKFNSLNAIPQQPFRKIYVSRKYSNARNITNEDELLNILNKYNIEIFHFENMSISQQIKLLQETIFIIGPHGAGLSNILFVPNITTVLEIRNKCDTHWNMFYAMASDLSLNYFYYLAEPDSNDSHNANLTIDLKEIEILLENIMSQYTS